MKSRVTKTFRKRLHQLLITVQEQAEKAYALWRENPYHTSLQFKQVSQRHPFTLLVSASIIEFWDCLSLMTTFTGSGLEHTMSTMSC